MDHWLNGEHDHAIVQCQQLGQEADKWHVKSVHSNCQGVITIHHQDHRIVSWNWDGSPDLLNSDQTMTEELEGMFNTVEEAYDGWA